MPSTTGRSARRFRVEARRLHLSAVNNQEEQDVDRAVPRVIELTLRDRAGDRMPDGMSFQDLEVGFLIGTTQKPRRANRSALA